MTQNADGSGVGAPRRPREGAALFVLVREERGSTDMRFVGEISGTAARQFPDVVRQVMRRSPSFIHLDLREATFLDDGGVKELAHAVRICRRHGAMVKISTCPPVEDALEAAGANAALGILPRDVRDGSAVADGQSLNGSRRPAPRH